MHELSIAISIIEMVEDEVATRGAVEVTAVHLKLGMLSGVVKEALLFSYEVACAGTSLEGSKLRLHLPADLAFLAGEHLEGRLDQLAGVAGIKSSEIVSD